MRKSIKLDVRIDIVNEPDLISSTVTTYSVYEVNQKLSRRISDLIDQLIAHEPDLFTDD